MKLFYLWILSLASLLVLPLINRRLEWKILILIGGFTLIFLLKIARSFSSKRVFFALFFLSGIFLNLFFFSEARNASEIPNTTPINVEVNEVWGSKLVVKDQDQNKILLNKNYFIKGERKNLNVYIGDKVKGCITSKPINFDEKKSFNNYLRSKKITHQGWINSSCSVEVEKKNKIYHFMQNKNSQWWINYVIFQKKDEKIEENLNKAKDLGISHIFVVSGFHLLAISRLFFYIAKKNKKKIWNLFWILAGISICFFLTYLTNWKISSLKAFVLICFFSFRKLFKTKVLKGEETPFLCLIFLFFNPLFLFNLGFQLTFIISLVLSLNQEDLYKPSWFVWIKNFIKKHFLITIAILPILLNINFRISIFTVFFTMFYSLVFLVFYPFFLLTVWFPKMDLIHGFFFNFFEKSINFFWKNNILIPFGEWGNWETTGYYLFVFLFFSRNEKKWWSAFFWIKWIFIIFGIFIFHWTKDPYYHFHMIDVNHGMAMFLQSPDKRTNILFDAGSNPYKKNNKTKVISDYLKKLNVINIDAVFISHDHTDHKNNLNHIQNNFHIKQIFNNKNQAPNYQINEIKIKNLAYSYYQNMKNENNRSLVLQFQIHDKKILFTFDAEKKAEKEILKREGLQDIDLFQVGHHGSSTSSDPEFINHIRPKNCLISTKKTETKVDEILRKEGCKIYNTSIEKDIKVKILKNGLVINNKKLF